MVKPKSGIPVKTSDTDNTRIEKIAKDCDLPLPDMKQSRIPRMTRSRATAARVSESDSIDSQCDLDLVPKKAHSPKKANSNPSASKEEDKTSEMKLRRSTRASSVLTKDDESISQTQVKTPRRTRATTSSISETSDAPEVVKKTPPRTRATRSTSVLAKNDVSCSQVQLRTPRRTRAASNISESDGSANMSPPKNIPSRNTRASSKLNDAVSITDETDSEPLPKSAKRVSRTPSRSAKTDTALDKIDEREGDKESVQTAVPLVKPSTPSRSSRSTETPSRKAVKEPSQSPSRVTRAMRKAGFTTPTVDDDDVLTLSSDNDDIPQHTPKSKAKTVTVGSGANKEEVVLLDFSIRIPPVESKLAESVSVASKTLDIVSESTPVNVSSPNTKAKNAPASVDDSTPLKPDVSNIKDAAKSQFGLCTPARQVTDALSKNLMNILFTPAPVTKHVPDASQTPKVGGDDSLMDWESVPTPVSTTSKISKSTPTTGSVPDAEKVTAAVGDSPNKPVVNSNMVNEHDDDLMPDDEQPNVIDTGIDSFDEEDPVKPQPEVEALVDYDSFDEETFATTRKCSTDHSSVKEDKAKAQTETPASLPSEIQEPESTDVQVAVSADVQEDETNSADITKNASIDIQDHESTVVEKSISAVVEEPLSADVQVTESTDVQEDEPNLADISNHASVVIEDPESAVAEVLESTVIEDPESAVAEVLESKEPESTFIEEPESVVCEDQASTVAEDPEPAVLEEVISACVQVAESAAVHEADSANVHEADSAEIQEPKACVPEPTSCSSQDLNSTIVTELSDKKKKRKSSHKVSQDEPIEPDVVSVAPEEVCVVIDDEPSVTATTGSPVISTVKEQLMESQSSNAIVEVDTDDVAMDTQQEVSVPEPSKESQSAERKQKKKKRKSSQKACDDETLEPEVDDLAPEEVSVVTEPCVTVKEQLKTSHSEVIAETQNISENVQPEASELVATAENDSTLSAEKPKKKKKKSLKKTSESAAADEILDSAAMDYDDLVATVVAKKSKKSRVALPDANEEAVTMAGIEDDDEEEEVAHQANGDFARRFPDLVNFKNVFKHPSKTSSSIGDSLNLLYKWSCNLESRPDDLPDFFINQDDETVWQQLLHRQKQISKDYKKFKTLLDDAVVLPDMEQMSDSEEDISDVEDQDDDVEMDEEDLEMMAALEGENGLEDEEECDLFNLKDEDLNDLEKELEKDESSGDEEKKEDAAAKQKKFPKSSVDDQFFNLAEMDAFLDEAEQKEEEEGILATVDDSWGGSANYRYEEFFGKLDDAVAGGKKEKKTKKRKAEGDDSDKSAKKKKSVRFAMDSDDGEEEELGDEMDEADLAEAANDDAQVDGPVLMGDAAASAMEEEEEHNPTNLKKSLKKLKETIAKLEAENLEPRSWELSGEVAAHQREQNTLLETHVQFDHGAKNAPEITEDFTEKLEALIKQRIRDKVFDDVVRKVKSNERVEKYRNEAIEDVENVKKSLTEVYEKEYQKAAGDVDTTEKPNEVHVEIEQRMKNLFRMIDGLSHFEYTPPEVRPEVRVVSNMDALRVEEVGMMASTDAQLLAPEEMKKRQKGDLKAADERDKTDKLRERRKKKQRQRAMVMVLGEEKAFANNPKKLDKIKKKKASEEKPAKSNLKSSNFFNQLQETVRQELKEKTTRKKKVKSEKVASGGSKFKL